MVNRLTPTDTEDMETTSDIGYALEMLDEAAELSRHGERFADEVYSKVKEAAHDIGRELTEGEKTALVVSLRERGHADKMADSAVDFLVETIGEVVA